MKVQGPNSAEPRGARGWIVLAMLPLLTGCAAAVALPLLAGGTWMARDRHRVRAATQVPNSAAAARPAKAHGKKAGKSAQPEATLTSLKELPPPTATPAKDERWQQFFAYVQAWPLTADGKQAAGKSALLNQPPSIDLPTRSDCSVLAPAVVIDLDDGAEAFVPDRLAPAPAEVADGLARLRQAGIVVLWISRLPAARAADVEQALRKSGLDPQGIDQLLLVRSGGDRKQLLRQDASKDVCIVAIAGDQRGDFDELFDYLRNPESAFGLDPMIGDGWFLVPSLDAAAKGN